STHSAGSRKTNGATFRMKAPIPRARNSQAEMPALPTGSEPAWRRVCEALRRAVVSGVLPAGGRLPSTRGLAAFYGVSRNTILQAYEQLVAEGYFEGRPGSGTYVLT